MSTVNKAIILGRLGKDPEVRSTGNADVANLSVATSETWKDKRSGERKEKTEWHRVTVWNENAIKFIDEHLKKGDQVYIEGKIETRKYDKDGVEHYTTEIIVPQFGGEVKKIWERDGSGGGSDRDDDRGSGRGSSRSSSRDRDDRGGDDRGSRGRSSSRSRDEDRGGDDRGSRGGSSRGSSRRDDDRNDERGGNDRGRSSGRGSSNNDMDDDIPF